MRDDLYFLFLRNPPSTYQAFNVSSEVGISEWLSGRMELPPGAIKDSEHVALSTQIYVVAEGQPNALELAIAMPSKKASRSGLFCFCFYFYFFVFMSHNIKAPGTIEC